MLSDKFKNTKTCINGFNLYIYIYIRSTWKDILSDIKSRGGSSIKEIFEFLNEQADLLKIYKNIDLSKLKYSYDNFMETIGKLGLEWAGLKNNLLNLRAYMNSLEKGLMYESIIRHIKFLTLVDIEYIDPDIKNIENPNIKRSKKVQLCFHIKKMCNRILCDCAYYDILLNDFDKLTNFIPEWDFYSFPSYPLFFYKLINNKERSVSDFKGGLNTAKRLLFILLRSINNLALIGHYTIATDLIKYCRRLTNECAIAVVKDNGGDLSIDSPDFLFYYVNFINAIKNNNIDENHPLVKVISKENLLSMIKYHEFCDTGYYNIRSYISFNKKNFADSV